MNSSTPGWESVKENAAPLQRGRNVVALERATVASRGLGSQSQLTNEESAQRIEEFERMVRPSEAPHVTETQEDCLVHWMVYIKYSQDNFPSDTHQQFLLMERCTRALVKMPQYANDDRFISVCAKYADKTKEPGQVFKYLYQQKVGQKTALFWVAWAFVAEKSGDFPFAENIYKKGISKDAQPMNMLKVRHKQFQRRMSRYWLNSSQQNEQLDDYDDGEGAISRGTLVGLSHDRVRHGDRSRVAPQLSQRSRGSNLRATTNFGDQGGRNNSNTAGNGSMSIYVENEGENAPNNFLDRPIVEHKRVIEREADRRKENTLDAERWNDRGGLMSTSSSSRGYRSRSAHSRTGSLGAQPAAFAVFVDEECVAQHERIEREKQNQADRHRTTRDERTFRDRADEGLAERLARDPLRYVRDPTQFDSDLEKAAKEHEDTRIMRNCDAEKSSKRANIGFSKRLLKDAQGMEQSFEQARGVSMCYTIATDAVNFNLLHVNKMDQSSRMDLDEEESTDISMGGSSSKSARLFEEQPRKGSRLPSSSRGKVLFVSETNSRNTSLNQTAISNASSVVNESDAVGVPTRKEEETINTKLAMRELSMMFSSPAFGIDNLASRTERRMNYMSRFDDDQDVDTSYADVGESLGPSVLDNSIVNYDNENRGPRNPAARAVSHPRLDAMALREISSDSDVDATALSCSARNPRPFVLSSQENPIRGIETDLDENTGFQIFEDENNVAAFSSNVNTKGGITHAQAGMFRIFEDAEEDDKKPAAATSTMYEQPDGRNDFDCTSSDDEAVAQGDTATFSLLADVCGLDESDRSRDGLRRRDSSIGVSEQGDTATLSVFNDVFADLNESRHQPGEALAPHNAGFSIFVDDEDDQSSKSVRVSHSTTTTHAVDYLVCHDHAAKMALRRLQASASVPSNSRSPLLALLSLHGQIFHLPHISLPREFRSKRISGNITILIGKHAGVMCRELGRGAYGVVVLMDINSEFRDGPDVIAVKAQTPTNCLAWEYDILRKLEERTNEGPGTHAFPNPFSFISLADGGILSMTAGSRTGFNLVDLANIYKLKLGEHVPEIVCLHYVSRMLRHLEQLHWKGKIIHCDVKPDNFVMCTLDCGDNHHRDIQFSDLMLVDFGRAVDLEDHTDGGIEARSVLFRGDACEHDAQCLAMRAGKPWSYDVDTFGILACAHVLLWGTHISLRKGKNGRWYLTNSFKRYWQKDLWTSIFDKLLNLDEEPGGGIGSRARSLRSLRMDINEYTETESEKLRSFLTRQVSLLPSSRDQLM